MNKERRKNIENVKARIAQLQAQSEEIKTDIQTILEEQEYRENIPESMADSEKAEKADGAINALEQVIQDLESLIENDFNEQLDTAAE